MTTAPKVPLSVWCDGAKALGVPEGHVSCPGTWEQRLPTTPPEWPPLQKYVCGCPCHTKETES
jgi:hypothetical protein